MTDKLTKDLAEVVRLRDERIAAAVLGHVARWEELHFDCENDFDNFIRTHHAEIAQNAEAVVTLREELEDYKNAALHTADDLRSKDAEIKRLAESAKRLDALEQAMGECMVSGVVLDINMRADEIMLGGE